jgi:hypothetical protein
MSDDTLNGSDAARDGQPRWRIIEHVPLPATQRALPPAATPGQGTSSAAARMLGSPRTERTWPDGGDAADSDYHGPASLAANAQRAPTPRHLFTDLDHLLADTIEGEILSSGTPAGAANGSYAAGKRRARHKRRRLRRLAAVLVLLAVVSVAIATLEPTWLHLIIGLPLRQWLHRLRY